MFYSKPLPPFVCDLLYYLNRDQLELFSIVNRPLKNFINRYFHLKPYRVFDHLVIREGSYALFHKSVRWHPNRSDYSVQQFLAGQRCSIDITWNSYTYYSFAEMRPYLRPNVRINSTAISVAENFTYNTEHIAEMESITYLWSGGNIRIKYANGYGTHRIVADYFQPILNSPTILQCQFLEMENAHFSFKDCKVLYAVKVIEARYYHDKEIDLWLQFLQQPGVKPVIVFRLIHRKDVNNFLDRLTKAFSSAVLPNAFKISFYQIALTEFRETNNTSGEILELKEGLPVEFPKAAIEICSYYTLERSSI